ncbi:MAG TPA: ABC transporter ATP-binding protein [Longimicrobiales bacterium]|nr:ABC transporter ATP-binding protein [Longimicrobiales bacterium]
MNELRSLLPFLKPYRAAFAAGLLLVVVSNAFQVAAPMLVGMAVDGLGRPDVTHGVILGHAGLVVLAALCGGATRFGMRQILNGVSRRVETDLRDAFFDHLLRMDASFYQRHRTGDLMSRATNDTQAVRMAAGPAIMYLVNTVVLTAFAVVLMVRISPSLTAATIAPLLLLPPVVLGFGKVIHRRFERIQDQFGVMSTLVQENLAGVRIVRAYRQEGVQAREFEELNREYHDRNMALARTSGVFHPALTLLAGAGMVVLVWYGGSQLVAGAISVGDFVAFAFLLGMLTWPMIALGWVINLFQQGAASMGRLNRILSEPAAITNPPDAVVPREIRGEIEFDDVWFRYPGSDRDVLRGVSFRIRPGQTVALVGPTGSGKSTIVALLARLYDPTAGRVMVDGVPVNRYDLGALRRAMGIVPQEAFVFSETIEENVALGVTDPDVREQAVLRAAEVARLDEAVAEFPQGYQTLLGERGVNLSGGQRQRATLARALARDPRILVLDDALSAVDTRTESEILTGLDRELRGRTALIISHRLTAIMRADMVLVLNEGRIVERGTHADLLARNGLYASLLRRQLLEEEMSDEGATSTRAARLATGTDPA